MRSERGITIDGRRIGAGHPPYVIAEMSANHGGSLEHAERVIREAKARGAHAVKLQTYTADTMTIECDLPVFRIGSDSLWANRTLHDLYQEAHTPWEWQPRLKELADQIGITLFSTPFDATAVEFLEEMNVPAYKVASFELVDLPLIDRIARCGKPMILSTGMGSLPEIAAAVATCRAAGNDQLVLLKCTSAYPAPASEMDLRTIPHLADAFDVATGLSDHTLGTAVPVAAVALGACVIEKHFCLSRSEGGPDSSFSMEPADLEALVADTRTAWDALGRVRYGIKAPESSNTVFRRSLFVVEDVAAGEEYTDRNVRAIRPGNGLPPGSIGEVLGRVATRAAPRGTPLAWDLIGGKPA